MKVSQEQKARTSIVSQNEKQFVVSLFFQDPRHVHNRAALMQLENNLLSDHSEGKDEFFSAAPGLMDEWKEDRTRASY